MVKRSRRSDLSVLEAEVLSAAETCAGLGYVFAQAVTRGDLDHASEAKRRKQFGEAVEVLVTTAFGWCGEERSDRG